MAKKITFCTTDFLSTTPTCGCFERFSSIEGLKTCPDEEGIKTRPERALFSKYPLKTCPDEEGIKTLRAKGLAVAGF